jgi:hypothetical protein
MQHDGHESRVESFPSYFIPKRKASHLGLDTDRGLIECCRFVLPVVAPFWRHTHLAGGRIATAKRPVQFAGISGACGLQLG